MAKELIVSQTLNEYRAALMENGEIIDYLMDRSTLNRNKKKAPPRVGNIYKGRVLRVLPGMQSAFVDIGYEKAAFLYVDDAYLPAPKEQQEIIRRGQEEQTSEKKKRPGEMIPDELSTLSESINMRFRPNISIESFIKEGQELIVQVAKEPIATKGPRITRHIALAGRYIVFMPHIEHAGVSRRIESAKERKRLKDIIESIKPESKGIIARTVAEGRPYKVLKEDFNMLVKIWKDVEKKSLKAKGGSLVYQDLNFLERVLRDFTDENVDRIIVDSKDGQREIERFANRFLPSMKGKTLYYNGENPLFEQHGIDLEVERALSNKVFLRSGGSLNIDQTEALVSIDVNTGKFVGRKTLSDTILRTNLEALKEIAYQLRIRNCGGLIIIDFIDMEKEENRKAVYQSLLLTLKKDRAKTNVLPISGLGLVEMTRKRTRDTLVRTMCEPCSYCEGTGRVKSIYSVSFELIRELNKVLRKNKTSKKIFIYAHPEVTAFLYSGDLDILETLEERFGTNLVIRSENNYHIEQYEIVTQNY